jgi:predicted dehydrogenase
VTDSPEEMRGLIDRARDAGRVLIPYQQRRFDGDFRTVQQIVASGVLGRIHHFESHWHMYRPKPKGVWRESAGEQGGIFYDLGPHLIDHTLQLFGRPHSVYAQIQANRGVVDVDDQFRLNLHYRNGLHVLLSADNLNPFAPPRFVVRGLNGAYMKHGMDPQEGLLRGGHRPVDDTWGREEPDQRGRLVLRVGDALSDGAVDGLPGDWRLYWRGVYDAIVQGAPPPVDPEDLLPQIEIMQAARESSRTGAAQVLRGA